jgi:hypothetical protein
VLYYNFYLFSVLLRCSKSEVSLKLRTEAPFYGRLFVKGFSEICDTTGGGANETVLIVTQECANFTENSVNANVILQYNPILQRRGDRSMNIFCNYGDAFLSYVNSSIEISEE